MLDIHPQNSNSGEHKKVSDHVAGILRPSGPSKILVLLLIVVSVLVITTMALGLWSQAKRNSLAKEGQYQAVFLTNGQVYFGKLSSAGGKYVSLSEVYYLQQNNQRVQPGDAETELSLIKLGNELHGPEGQMFISREQVLFWENLKADGRVVKAITENKE